MAEWHKEVAQMAEWHKEVAKNSLSDTIPLLTAATIKFSSVPRQTERDLAHSDAEQ